MIAHLIDNTVTRQGDFVARYGGEEFAVLLSNTTEKGAAILAERIRENVEREIIDTGGVKTRITVSLGVAAITTNINIKNDSLIRLADCALYQAKKTGRNKVIRGSTLTDYTIV